MEFIETVWQEGRRLFRPMPWRENPDPYWVLVSEIMLQQTQVDRVVPKFQAFLAQFPTPHVLAAASLGEVLTAWSGLGYNRRAKFLHQAAQKICTEFKGRVPDDFEALVSLPGIGPNTAGAILAYSSNRPVVFVETNIRTVYFHHFFAGRQAVTDKEVMALVQETLDYEHPREWYWALMDYGAFLKKQGLGALDVSATYRKQSPLKGSVREVRGIIIRELTQGPLSRHDLINQLPTDSRATQALAALIAEGMVSEGPADTLSLRQ